MNLIGKIGVGERSDWGGFPEVIRNGNLGDLKKQPEYEAAKNGDSIAALDIVERLLTHETIEHIQHLIGQDKPLLLPVQVFEENGYNKIPAAMAALLGERLNLNVDNSIVQQEKLFRTGSSAYHRLAFNPTFNGGVAAGQKYFIVDDNLTMGGTIASLRGYIENRGGKDMGASVMVARHGAENMVVRPGTLTLIKQKHGEAINKFWKEAFGYGIAQLTQAEAKIISKSASIDSIRDQIISARNDGIRRIDEGRNKKAQTPTRERPDGLRPSEGLLVTTQNLEVTQEHLLSDGHIDASLKTYVQAKHAQVQRIESRLQNLISRQQDSLQRLSMNKPGILSMPQTRHSWQAQQTQQQSRLQTLKSRLVLVGEIKEGMRVDSPRIKNLVVRQLRLEHPELAAQTDLAKAEERRRKLEQQIQQKKQSRSMGRSRTLNNK